MCDLDGICKRGFQAARITNPNDNTQPAALDFVKPGQLSKLRCKGTFPQNGESTCLLSGYISHPSGYLQYRRNRDIPKVSYAYNESSG
ncbi:hypothetical protein P5V15_015692 [Pogonomyrmex californicus]